MVVRAMVHMEVTLPLDQVEVKDLVMVQQNHGSEMGTGYAQIQVVEI
jgi:ethanolamine utilization protein EutQ (cupin superfamily)